MNLENSPASSAFKSRFRLLVALLLSASVLLSGCTTLRSVPLPAPGQPASAVTVKVGDTVHVQLKSGEALDFRITSIGPDALVGKRVQNEGDVQARFRDIADLQVKRVDPLRTGVAVVGGAAAVAFIALLVAAASGGIAFMPGGP